MAVLRNLSTGESYTLTSSFTVGRSHRCALRLDHRMVSGQHAEFQWTGSGWELRDLGSSNGTFVDQRRLSSGERIAVTRGARFAFGDETADDVLWQLIDDAAPVAAAENNSGDRIVAEEEFLDLPDSDNPEFTVFQSESGNWCAEALRDGQRHEVSDGDRISAGGVLWQLSLPLVLERTWRPESGQIVLASMGLRFAPSLDEEHVSIAVLHRGELRTLRPRAHGYLLLTLARQLLDDRKNPDLPESEHGWIHVPDLAKDLKISDDQINMHIHRAKRQLHQEAGVVDSMDLIERRPTSRQLRLGVRRVAIVEP